MRRERFESVVRTFVVVTNGRLVRERDLGRLLRAMRKVIPDVTEAELRDCIARTLGEGRRRGAALERAMRRGCRR
jgi:hypothetical protein